MLLGAPGIATNGAKKLLVSPEVISLLFLIANIVTTSKAPVTTSVALVTSKDSLLRLPKPETESLHLPSSSQAARGCPAARPCQASGGPGLGIRQIGMDYEWIQGERVMNIETISLIETYRII